MRLGLEQPQESEFMDGLRYMPTGAFSLVIGASNDRNTATLVENVRGLLKPRTVATATDHQTTLRTVHMNRGEDSPTFLDRSVEPYSVEEVRGTFPESFCKWAEENSADIIAVGKPSRVAPLTGKSYWWLRRMIQETNVPVLIVPDGSRASHVDADTIRVLLADDLSHGGMSSIRALTDLASISKSLKIFHVHVQTPGYPSSSIQTFGADISETNDRYDEMDWGQSRESIHAQLYIRSALLRNSLPESLIEYEGHVLLGNISEELIRFSHARRIDLLACGRPNALRQKPTQTGNLTPKFLVAHNAVTFIAPEYSNHIMAEGTDAANKEENRLLI